jgi:predicted Zn-dependent peptidase
MNIMKSFLLLSIISVISAFQPTFVQAGGTVNQFTLSNGVKVIHKEITEHPLITVQIFFKGGVINEKESQAGIANFTQALLFQGTGKRSSEQISQEIEDIGANISSDIEYDYASIGLSLMDTALPKAMDILADVAFNPSFPAEEIEKERMNILAGIQSRKDSIFNVANDLFNRTFYGNHPYSWPDIGKADTVSKITRDDLINWHKTQYGTKNMMIVIAGNVSLDNAKKLTEQYFSKCPQGISMAAFPPATEPKAQSITERSKKFKQALYMSGIPAPSMDSPDFPVLKVINALLGGRMSGRLFVELREKLSLAYEVSSFYPSRKELSRFVVYLGLEKKNLPTAKKRIKELLAELCTTAVGAKELEETKNYIRGVYFLDHQTIGRQAWYMGWWEVMGKGYDYDEKYLQKLISVTPEDIQRVAKKYFTGPAVEVEVLSE